MADLTITAANVVWVSGAIDASANAGEAISAGQAVYKKTSTGKWMLAQADGTAEEAGSGVVFGIALNTGVANQPLAVQTSGVITIGATVTVAKVYVLSATAGGIAPIADITTSTQYVTLLATGSTTARLDLSIKLYTGLQIP